MVLKKRSHDLNFSHILLILCSEKNINLHILLSNSVRERTLICVSVMYANDVFRRGVFQICITFTVSSEGKNINFIFKLVYNV